MLKNTPLAIEPYQRTYQEKLEQGQKEALQERQAALEEGAKEALSEVFVNIVQICYPKLERFARVQIEIVQNHVTIQRAILQLISLQTEDEVMRLLRDIDDVQV